MQETRETWVWSLQWEDLLEEEMATHSSILAWEIPGTEEPGRLQSMGLQRTGHDWTSMHTHTVLNGSILYHPCKCQKDISVQFSRLVVSCSLWPHGLQHARLPRPSPTPGTQTHVHCISDAIQPSHPLSSPSPPAFNLSQHQGLFQWVSSLY